MVTIRKRRNSSSSNRCHASSNRCLTSSNKKLLVTGALKEVISGTISWLSQANSRREPVVSAGECGIHL